MIPPFSSPAPPAIPPAGILLVDDRPENLLALEAVLEGLGQRLIRAESGEAALRQLMDTDVALILLDVQMPGINGFETAKLIKSRERTRHIPIIFMTAISKEDRYVFEGYSVGAVDYITKPFDPDILRSKVEVFVDLYRKSELLKAQTDLLYRSREREQALLQQQQLDSLAQEGARRYRDLAEAMPQIVWTATPDGKLDSVNGRWAQVTGLTFEQTKSEGLLTAVHPDDLEPVRRSWVEAVADGHVFEQEMRIRSVQTGGYRWYLLRASLLRDGDGNAIGWIGTSTDIDDQRAAQEGLQFLAEASVLLSSSLDYPKTLTSVAGLAVPHLGDWCSVDIVDEATGEVRTLAVTHIDPNKLALARELNRRFPPDPNALTGVPQVIRSSQPELVSEITDEMLTATVRDKKQLKLVRQLGLRSYMCVPITARERVLGAISLVAAESGRRYGPADLVLAEDLARRAGVAIDNALLYAEAQAAEQEVRTQFELVEASNRRLAELNDELQRASAVKNNFLSTVSHELRTPLTSIKSFSKILLGDVDRGRLNKSRQHEFLAIINDECDRLTRLINDVLDIAKMEAGKMSWAEAPVDLGASAQKAAFTLQPVYEAKDVRLLIDSPTDLAPLWGDEDKLQQVVTNLLSNALKFTPTGGEVRLRVAPRRAGEVPLPASAPAADLLLDGTLDPSLLPAADPQTGFLESLAGGAEHPVLHVSVADTGIGIAPDNLARVFDQFQQVASDALLDKPKGTGLGLSISKHIVEHYGGRIWVESRLGHGSTFHILLPIPPPR